MSKHGWTLIILIWLFQKDFSILTSDRRGVLTSSLPDNMHDFSMLMLSKYLRVSWTSLVLWLKSKWHNYWKVRANFCLTWIIPWTLTSWWPQRCLTSVTNTSTQRFSVYITWLCSLLYKLENKCKWFPLNIGRLLSPLGNKHQKHKFIYTVETNHSM